MASISQRLIKCAKPALPKAIKTALWLLKITIPVTFVVMVMNYFGYLEMLSSYMQPFFVLLGLPAESAFVLLTSIFTNVYSALAIISTLGLPIREATILGLMCLIAHGFIIETAIVKKSGSNVFRMLALRVSFSIIGGLILNYIMPASDIKLLEVIETETLTFSATLYNWAHSMLILALKIIFIVSILFIFQNIMEEFGVIRILSNLMKPFMRVLGLPQSTSVSLIIVNTIGLAYGAAMVLDQLDKGKMSKADADLLNHHAVISHSQVEDPILFLSLGVTMHWLIWPRFLLAIIAVWLRKLELHFKYRKQSVLSPT